MKSLVYKDRKVKKFIKLQKQYFGMKLQLF